MAPRYELHFLSTLCHPNEDFTSPPPIPLRAALFDPHPSVSSLLNERVKDVTNSLCALLGISLLSTLVIHIRDSKPRLEALGPLEIVHQGPSHVAPDIHPIQCSRVRHCTDIAVEVLHSEIIR